ncbi:acyltransferase family protein [Serratia sp. CY80841]|uniref:acyltransferase family protein n=1 Tax=Serratia sp. CY80841 TaxID=3383682 RepID=UPI003F9EE37D
MVNKNFRLSGLDGIRGALAIIVALSHSFGHFTGWESGLYPFKNVSFSVDVFFILSGMVLYHAHAIDIKNGSLSPQSFFLKRLLRLYPLHLFTILLVPLCLFISIGTPYPEWLGKSTIQNIFGDSLLMNAIGIGFDFSSNQPSWSISVEMYIGTILIYVSCLTMAMPILFVFISATLFFIFNIAPPEGPQYHAFLVNGGIVRCLFSMSIGIMAYKLTVANLDFLKSHKKLSICISSFGFAAIVLIVIFINLSVTEYIIATPLIALTISTIGLMDLPEFKFLDSKILSILGQRSFSIYLMHTPVIYLFLFLKSSNNLLNSFMAILSILITISVSKYTLKYIEKPFIKISKKL